MLSAINDLKRHNMPLVDQINHALKQTVESGWYILGNSVAEFEKKFAAYCGVNHCMGLANGTDALELSLRATGIVQGDTVISVANAGGYSTTAILLIGATPCYCDIHPDTLIISPQKLSALLNQVSAKAVIVTHLYGLLAPMDEITEICKQHGVILIEDCAQAHGAEKDGRKAGSFGDIACFSFYPTKNLGAIGDGGAIVTNNPMLAEKIALLRQYGWKNKYHSVLAGAKNSRLDELQASVLNVKLPYLDGWNRRRREIASLYSSYIVHPEVLKPNDFSSAYIAHLYIIRCARRESLRLHLKSSGVPCDIHYPIPDHRQPVLESRFSSLSLPATEKACNEVLTLPCFPEMTDSEVKWVADAINKWKEE